MHRCIICCIAESYIRLALTCRAAPAPVSVWLQRTLMTGWQKLESVPQTCKWCWTTFGIESKLLLFLWQVWKLALGIRHISSILSIQNIVKHPLHVCSGPGSHSSQYCTTRHFAGPGVRWRGVAGGGDTARHRHNYAYYRRGSANHTSG